MRWGRCGVFAAGAVASALQWQAEARAQSVQLPAIVVTPSGRVEPGPARRQQAHRLRSPTPSRSM